MGKSTQIRYYVDLSTNVNDSFEISLSKDAHGLPIDLVEPICGVQQTRTFVTTTQDASFLVNL